MSNNRRHKRGHDYYLDIWHRPEHLKRYLGIRAQHIGMIDLDCCEYCRLCGKTVALIETKNVDARDKTIKVTEDLANESMVPVYLVEYQLTGPIQKCDKCGHPVHYDDQDINHFWVTEYDLLCVMPHDPITPNEYAEWLWNLRVPHWRDECTHPAAGRMLDY